VLLITGGRRPGRERAMLDGLLEYRTDGIILVSPRMRTADLLAATRGTPTVVVGRRLRAGHVDSVLVDEAAGARLAVQHLVELGHERIVHVDGGRGAGGLPRKAGYERAMRELGLRWRPLGYGSLLVAVLTGAALAARDWDDGRSPFKTVLWVKVALVLALIGVSYLHNYVYGPRLQRELREHGTQTTRPTLVVVGWTSLGLTLTVPLLGVALARLAS